MTLTDTRSLPFLPRSGDPAVCPPAWLFHAAMAVQSPCCTGISWWLPSTALRAGSTPSVGTLLQMDTFLSYCRKDTKCQSHDGQHWPLKGLRICQLREARRSPEGKRLLAARLLSLGGGTSPASCLPGCWHWQGCLDGQDLAKGSRAASLPSPRGVSAHAGAGLGWWVKSRAVAVGFPLCSEPFPPLPGGGRHEREGDQWADGVCGPSPETAGAPERAEAEI